MAHGARTDAYVLLAALLEREGFRAIAAEPEVLHSAHTLVGSRRCQGIGNFEYKNTSVTQVVKWFAAFRICTVIDHGGYLRFERRSFSLYELQKDAGFFRSRQKRQGPELTELIATTSRCQRSFEEMLSFCSKFSGRQGTVCRLPEICGMASAAAAQPMRCNRSEPRGGLNTLYYSHGCRYRELFCNGV
jgi:hypothetical protein